MKTVGIMCDRDQLIIPTAVTISVINPDEIVIKPLAGAIGWDAIRSVVKTARAIKGKKSSISTIEFLENDRKSH